MLRIVVALYGDSHTPYAAVLLESLRQVGQSNVEIVGLDVHPDSSNKDRVSGKLTAWYEGFAKCQDGDDVVFLDADTMVVKPLGAAFDHSFDVAHTVRYDRRWKINSGVVFVRASEKTRKWFRVWRDLSAWAYASEERNQIAIAQWGHVDQATLPAALAMHQGYDGLKVATLAAEIWNEDRVSKNPDDVAIFHFKGVLDLLLEPYVESDYGDQRLRKDQFEAWRGLYEKTRHNQPLPL